MKGKTSDFVNRSYKILNINKKFKPGNSLVFDKKLNKGLITHEQCFKKFFNVPITEQQMKKIKQVWISTWAPTKEMINLIKKLSKKYTLAILSNSDSLNSRNYATKGWYSYFDHLILSHELGILKPNKKIYQIALKKINRPTKECIF